MEMNLPHVVGFYSRIYNNLVEVDGLRSVWSMEDCAITLINSNAKARLDFATNLFF